jgi:hypothetical protein
MALPFVPVIVPQRDPDIAIRDFAERVATMRRLQRSYFKFRSPEVMHKCKRLEQEVDTACRQILGTSPRDDRFELSNDDGNPAA